MAVLSRLVETMVAVAAIPLFAPEPPGFRRPGLTPFTAGSVDATDAAFAVEAAESGRADIALSELALERSQTAAVRDLAHRMVADHTSLDGELTTIALPKRITLPLTLSEPARHARERLALLPKDEFDAAYLGRMVENHRVTVAAFRRQADHGRDLDLTAFAARALPLLREHLEMAERLTHSNGAEKSKPRPKAHRKGKG